MDDLNNLSPAERQRLLFGISKDELQRRAEREQAKDDARARTLVRFRDYAENNHLPLLAQRVQELRSTPRAQPAEPTNDDVSPTAVGGVPAENVPTPTAPVGPIEASQVAPAPPAPVVPPVAPPSAPEVPVTPPTPPEAPSEPEVPSTPETPAETPSVPAETPSAPETPAPTEPAALTAAGLVDNSPPADDGSSDDTTTNSPSDNEV